MPLTSTLHERDAASGQHNTSTALSGVPVWPTGEKLTGQEIPASTLTAEVTGRQGRPKYPRPAGETNHVVDCLNMRGWQVKRIVYFRDETIIEAKLLTTLTHCRCKKCKGDCQSTKLVPNGPTNTLHLHHTPLDERPRRIAYRRQRYLCQDCNHTSTQPVPGIYKGTRVTRQLRRYIVRQALVEPFDNIAKRVGLSERQIRNLFEKHRIHLEITRPPQTPRVMGIDGVYVKRKESLIVTDIEHNRPVFMAPFIKERAIANALHKLPNIDKVKEVVTDLAPSLDRVNKAVFPKAKHTKDRYHVERMANAAVDLVRKALTPGKRERKKGQMGMCRSHILRKHKKQLKAADQAALDWCLGLYPLLLLTYDLKEVYCEIWNASDSTSARLKYAAWLERHKAWKKQMPKDLRLAFDPLIKTMKRWDEGIFNFFNGRHTNAYTESANARVKEINGKAPNAKFTTVNTKVVHGHRLRQQRKAERERGKMRRRQAKRVQQPQLSLPPSTNRASRETSKGSKAETNIMMTRASPTATDIKNQGPRLEIDRIRELNRRREDGEDSSTRSSQMSLFA